MPQSVTVAAFVAGLILIVAALVGKEVKIAAIELPALGITTRIVSGFLGILLIYIGLFDPFTPRQTTQPSATISPLSNVTPVFKLQDANRQTFYTTQLRDPVATIVFRADSTVRVDGRYWSYVFLRPVVPENFRASIRIKTEHPKDAFTIGIGSSTNLIYHYAFVYSALASRFVVEGSDVKYDDKSSQFLATANTPHTIILERQNGGMSAFVDGALFFSVQDRGSGLYNQLFLTIENQQDKGDIGSVLIEDFIVELLN